MFEYKCIIMFLGLLLAIFIYFAGRRKRQKTVESIQSGKEVLVSWSYSPDDWKIYGEDMSSSWIKNKDIPGEAFITTENIYVTNGSDEYFYEFGSKQVTQCSFHRSFLDLRVEWSKVNRNGGLMDGQSEYYHEDFRLFVPDAKQEEVLELVAEFKAMTESNHGFSRKFVKDNEITSLFGNDNF